MTDEKISDAQKEYRALVDRKIGKGASCATCRFAFPVKVSLRDTVLDCRQCPPQPAWVAMMDRAGNIAQVKVSNHYVARTVASDFACGAWQIDPQPLDS